MVTLSSHGISSPSAPTAAPPSLANRDRPLSWEEARSILRKSLEKYLDDASPQEACRIPPSRPSTLATTVSAASGATTSESQHCASSFLSHWIRLDLDLYLGAVLLSVALLVVSSFHWSLSSGQDDDPLARGELAGAVLLTVGALSGVWVVRRRRFLCLHDSNVARRREVRKFLRATTSTTTSTSATTNTDNTNNTNNDSSAIPPPPKNSPDKATTTSRPVPEISNLTAQTGVYPVYRRRGNKCVWSRIPSLLLVEGDWIALQIGDVGPAHCRLLNSDHSNNNNNDNSNNTAPSSSSMQIQVGERLTVEHFAPTTDQLTASLPRGRKTLSVQDATTVEAQDHFLTMCNNMHLFVIVESPMEDFLRRQSVSGPSSQISIRLRVIRETLFVLSLIFFLLIAAIGMGRLFGRDNDMDVDDNNKNELSATDRALDMVHMPILAALGVLPVVAPAFLFFLEVVGTSRILTTVHAYSNMADKPTNIRSDDVDGSRDSESPSLTKGQENGVDAATKGNARLFLRYILATSLTRLSLWSLHDLCRRFLKQIGLSSHGGNRPRSSRRAKLVRVPPASVNLLEKIGVATAFTLVDDELACEPQSIPQQLLIPSGKGLKLLDLCPAYESDGSDDEKSTDSSSMAARRAGRKQSLDDSDSESDEGGRPNKGGGMLRRKILLKRMRRRRSELHRSVISDDDETQDTMAGGTRVDVQFEDPNWWQYLPSLKCIGLACLMHEEQKKTEVAEDDVSSSASDLDFLATSMKSDSHMESVVRQTGARSALVKLVCHERQSRQYRSLAECIGFSTQENVFGPRGDITPFVERLRLHILSNQLYKDRLTLDTHERSSEQSRWWGLIRADSTSVVIEDSRTKAYQLLTVGDPVIVMKLCNEAWQGEISTILPLAASDRNTIIDTSNSWKLADLDVAAFSYTPVPRTLETQLSAEQGSHVCYC